MELKFNALVDEMQANGSFNRTFMELKLKSGIRFSCYR